MTITAKKPKWRYPKETVLTAAPNGQWVKKHKGRVYYFGVWADPHAALLQWRREWPAIVAGGTKPQETPAHDCTLKLAINNYLASRLADLEKGEIVQSTYRELNDIGRRIMNCIGGTRLVQGLGPDDFDKLSTSIAKLSAIARQKFVLRTKTIFRWIEDHLGIRVNMGANFRAPPRKAIRAQLNRRDVKVFTPDQIHRLLEVANAKLKAMMLLAINGGFGNRDISELPTRAVDLDGAVIDFYRHKTEARRVVPLWPETVTALKAVLVPGQERLFLDRFGKPFERNGVYGISLAMKELAAAAQVPATFYWFRYTFATVAAEVPDDHARRLIMGHVIDGVSEGYVRKFPPARLRAVTDHVREWLYNRIRGSG